MRGTVIFRDEHDEDCITVIPRCDIRRIDYEVIERRDTALGSQAAIRVVMVHLEGALLIMVQRESSDVAALRQVVKEMVRDLTDPYLASRSGGPLLVNWTKGSSDGTWNRTTGEHL